MVKVGDPLVSLDPADARVVLEQAEANLAQTVRQVRGLFADDNQYQAQMAARQADLSRAQDDLRRRLPVAQTGAVSQEEISHAHDAVKSAQAAVDAAEQQRASNRALTASITIANHPNVQAAAVRVCEAYLSNLRNNLPAPVTGYVAKRSVQVGQRVSLGTPLMVIVPLGGVWVDANFKEVQLKHMRIGHCHTGYCSNGQFRHFSRMGTDRGALTPSETLCNLSNLRCGYRGNSTPAAQPPRPVPGRFWHSARNGYYESRCQSSCLPEGETLLFDTSFTTEH